MSDESKRVVVYWLIGWPILLPVFLALLCACWIVGACEWARQTLWPDSLGG